MGPRHGQKGEPDMRRGLLIFILTGALSACATPGPQPAEGTPAARGRAFADATCSRCHDIGGEGSSPNRAATPFRRIATRYSDVELSRRLADLETGHYRMPPLRVSEAQLSDLVAYLKLMRGR